LELSRAVVSSHTQASGIRGFPVGTQAQVRRRDFWRVRTLLNMVPPLRSVQTQVNPRIKAQIKRVAWIVG
jgi:hypothetical protein